MDEIKKGEEIEKRNLLKETKSIIKEKNLSEEEKEFKALELISRIEVPELTTVFRHYSMIGLQKIFSNLLRLNHSAILQKAHPL